MKKILKSLLVFISAFCFIGIVDAATVNFGVSTSANQVIVGKVVTVNVTISSSVPLGSWEYTLNYDHNVFKCTDSGYGLSYAAAVQNPSTYSVTYTYKFVAQNAGSGNFYVDSSNAFDFDEKKMTPSNGSRTVKAITYAQYQASLSKNNYLESLEVEGYEVTPEFDKETEEYSVQVRENETSINIIARPEDGSASVTGAGEVDVTSGDNKFDIVVVAENGSERKYILNVEVVDKDPIKVSVDDKDYTVVKVAANLNQPIGYKETTVQMGEYEIPAFTSDVTGYTLVGLKDEDADISLFIYEDGKYSKYIELNFGKLVIAVLPLKDELKGYTKATRTIQNNDIEVLETGKKSRHKVIYAKNVETGEEAFYLYDTKDDMALKYDTSYYNKMNKQIKILIYAIICLGGITLICLISIISSSSKNKSMKKAIVKELNSVKDDFLDGNLEDDTNEIKEEKKSKAKNKKNKTSEINTDNSKEIYEEINEIVNELASDLETEKKKNRKSNEKNDNDEVDELVNSINEGIKKIDEDNEKFFDIFEDEHKKKKRKK